MARRSPLELSPLPVPFLPELRPVVLALNRLFAGLGEALSQAQRFAYHASHELRTPLAALKGYLEVLERVQEPRALEGALREARRMEAILSGLLQLARLEGRPLGLSSTQKGWRRKEKGWCGRTGKRWRGRVDDLLENARFHGAESIQVRLLREGSGVWI